MLLLTVFVLFFVVHSFPFFRAHRLAVIQRIGLIPFRMLFALCNFVLLYVGVLAWYDFSTHILYEPPVWMKQVHLFLMFPAFYLWVAARGPSHIKRWVRHPMLVGIIIWGAGHLLANGDTRSMLLFVSMLVFACVAIVKINQRDEPLEPLRPRWAYDVFALIVGSVAYAAFAFHHGDLIGMPVKHYYTGLF